VSVKLVIGLGVLLVVLFFISIGLGACGNNSAGSGDLSSAQKNVEGLAGSLITKPLTLQDVRESTACVTLTTGCLVGPNQTRTFIVLKSDDNIRRVRRATFAQLKAGSTPGSAVKIAFRPVNDSPSTGEVHSTVQLTPTPTAATSPEVGRVQVDISQNGGAVDITCVPPTAACLVKLASD